MSTTRLLAALLAVSLAGHAAWLLREHRGGAAPATARTGHAAAPGPPSDPGTAPARESSAALAPDLDDPERFHRRLVEAGVAPKLRRELIRLVLQHRREPRFRALYPENGYEAATGTWWRENDGSRLTPAEQLARQRAFRDLEREVQAELARITGEDGRAIELAEDPWLARQFGGLPPEKAAALHRLQTDYQEMEQDIYLEAQNFQLPADVERLRLLREERERDIDALLTPEERARWELRASPTAERARHLATRFQASEEEYRALFALQQAFDAEFESDDGLSEPTRLDWQRHRAAQSELDAAVRALVGEERFLAANRETDHHYQLARFAAARLGLPPETAERIHDLRAPAAAESQRIVRDAALGETQKREALARLVVSARAAIERELGPEGAKVFADRGGLAWLGPLSHGVAVQIDNEGHVRPYEGPTGSVASPAPTVPIE